MGKYRPRVLDEVSKALQVQSSLNLSALHYTHPSYILITLSCYCTTHHPPFIKLHLEGTQTSHGPHATPRRIFLNCSKKLGQVSTWKTCFIYFHQCSRMKKKKRKEKHHRKQSWSSTALHKSRSGKVAKNLSNKQKYSTEREGFSPSVCAIRWDALCSCAHVIWRAEGEDFLWSTEISPCGLYCGQLLWYTATCWLGGSCTAAGCGIYLKCLHFWGCKCHVWYFVLNPNLLQRQPLPGGNSLISGHQFNTVEKKKKSKVK